MIVHENRNRNPSMGNSYISKGIWGLMKEVCSGVKFMIRFYSEAFNRLIQSRQRRKPEQWENRFRGLESPAGIQRDPCKTI
ncbi:hypothetical protein AVEN_97475-1 [Araneus ventricosus]|uniref:Uncharacterized protein n=1 Tax=Araneus ventricosus TaxID=182803 RepID=A0A4Y2M3R7_ARAVE|nr:hypothetical protein AVEN_97475-1 [Araneus ventricosus]